jgi:hypothetical protein
LRDLDQEEEFQGSPRTKLRIRYRKIAIGSRMEVILLLKYLVLSPRLKEVVVKSPRAANSMLSASIVDKLVTLALLAIDPRSVSFVVTLKYYGSLP